MLTRISSIPTVLKFLGILGTSIAPFLFTLHGDFVFDDSEAIEKNLDVTYRPPISAFYNDFWGTSIQKNFSHKSYRPFTILTFKLNYVLSGNKLVPYHFKISNLVLHSICCILMYIFGSKILKHTHETKIPSMDVSFYATILFAVHPVHTEAVCGIVGRADILAAITFLISFLLYNLAWKSRYPQTYFYLVGSIIFASSSMLFKEAGITVLGLCFAYEIIQNASIFDDNLKIQTKKHPDKRMYGYWNEILIHHGLIIRLVAISLSAILLLVGRWAIMGGMGPEFKPIDNPAAFADDFFTRVATYNYIYFLNFILLLWPHWLCFDWSMGCVPLVTSAADPRIVFVLIMFFYGLMISYYFIFKADKGCTKRSILMSLLVMILPFLPASNLFFPVGFVIAERVLYIPSIGYCFLVAIGIDKLLRNYNQTSFKVAISLAYFLLLSMYTDKSWHRSHDWQNEYELFTSGLKVCPNNAKVRYNVAKVADARHMREWALDEYEKAISLYPQYYQAMNNLANMFKNEGKFKLAEKHLRNAISHKQDFAPAWMNLGIILAATKRYDEAQAAYLAAIEHRKNYPDCYYNLGNLYLETNKTEEAIESWREAIRLKPKHNVAWTNLLALLDNSDQMDKALETVPEALAVLPNSPSINFVVANIYGKLDMYAEAEQHFLRAIQLHGGNAPSVYYANLGVLYHRWGKYKLADVMYNKALKVDPYSASTKKNLSELQKIIY